MVANEVKSLASQTAKATDEISSQVSAMQGATADAVQAIESIGRTIGSINEITSAISIAVDQQGSATREIARSVQEAAQGTARSRATSPASTGPPTRPAPRPPRYVLGGQLSSQAATLRADVDRFVANIRAA